MNCIIIYIQRRYRRRTIEVLKTDSVIQNAVTIDDVVPNVDARRIRSRSGYDPHHTACTTKRRLGVRLYEITVRQPAINIDKPNRTCGRCFQPKAQSLNSNIRQLSRNTITTRNINISSSQITELPVMPLRKRRINPWVLQGVRSCSPSGKIHRSNIAATIALRPLRWTTITINNIFPSS